MARPEIPFNIGKVDLQDVAGLVESKFVEGVDIVFEEEDYDRHSIYVTNTFMGRLGGYGNVNKLVRRTFSAVNETDPTKTRFYFGQHFVLGSHEVCGFDIYFPEGTYRPLDETQEKFIQAVDEQLSRKSG